MIFSPNLQVGLSFDNSSNIVEDIGLSNSTWSPRDGSAATTTGKFGKGYLFNGTNGNTDTNLLISNQSGNFASITSEWTMACWIYHINSTIPYFLMCLEYWLHHTNNKNYGILNMIREPTHGTFPNRIVVQVASQYAGTTPIANGISRGRWVPTIEIELLEWNFVCLTRSATEAVCYVYNDTNGFDKEVSGNISSLPTNYSFLNNGRNLIGGRQNAGVSIWRGNVDNQAMDSFQLWNTVLSESDVKRVMMGMHPLNS